MSFILGVLLTLVLQRIFASNLIIHKPLPTTTRAEIKEFSGDIHQATTVYNKEKNSLGVPVFKSHVQKDGRLFFSAVHRSESNPS
jgi:hypothetical protein